MVKVMRSVADSGSQHPTEALEDVKVASTCAQQNLAPSQELDGFGCFPETLLRQVRGVCNHNVKATRGDSLRQVQGTIVVIEDKLIPVYGESSVVFKDAYRDVLPTKLPELLVYTGRTHTCDSGSKRIA